MKGGGSACIDVSAARGAMRRARALWGVALTRSCVQRCSTRCLVPLGGSFSLLACGAGTDLGFDPFRISDWLDQDWAAKGELKST